MATLPPLVSIVLPVYNGEKYLSEAIESVVNQTHGNWELIIVDDCSTDRTPEIIQSFVEKDIRIVSVKNEENLKLPRSLNRGFSLAKGEFFAWTSDDNTYRPEAIERMLGRLLEKPLVDLVYTECTLIDEEGEPIRYHEAKPIEYLVDFNIVGFCFMYRRRLYEAVGEYDPGAFLVEDYEYWLRASLKCNFDYIKEDLYIYRIHSESLGSMNRQEIYKKQDQAVLSCLKDFPFVSNRKKAKLCMNMFFREKWACKPIYRWDLLRTAWGYSKSYFLRSLFKVIIFFRYKFKPAVQNN